VKHVRHCSEPVVGRSTVAWLSILAKLWWTTSAWIMERRLVDQTGIALAVGREASDA
jgi:hypothetical protein